MSWAKLFSLVLLVIGVWVVWLTFEAWAAAFLGVLLALGLNGPADWIRAKWTMPAWVATLLSLLMVLVLATGLVFMIGPPLVTQADELTQELPAAMERSLDWLDERSWGKKLLIQAESLSGMSPHELTSDNDTEAGQRGLDSSPPVYAELEPSDDASNKEQSESGGDDKSSDAGGAMSLSIFRTVVRALSVTASTITLLLIGLVLTVYIAMNPDIYRRGIFWMIHADHEEVAELVLSRICVALRWWILGRLVSMLMIGLLVSLGMWVVGMPSPLALGAIAGILSFVPNLGPVAGAVPGLLLAFPEGPWMLLYALIVYVVAEIIESNLISPLVDKYTVTTPPAALILTQVVMGLLAGLWGVLIAAPLFVVALVLIQQFYVLQYLEKPIKVVGSSGDDAPGGKEDSDSARQG